MNSLEFERRLKEAMIRFVFAPSKKELGLIAGTKKELGLNWITVTLFDAAGRRRDSIGGIAREVRPMADQITAMMEENADALEGWKLVVKD
jgi:ribosomal protein L7Ae-like RNA K-turn-binding protein